jgi:DnaJ like chaperone protein
MECRSANGRRREPRRAGSVDVENGNMSIWGKVVGGVAGFALGGPIGAILGAVAGHAVDRIRAESEGEEPDVEARQVAFTIAVIVLAAKMAKADGRVTRDEVDAFKQVFHIPPHEMKEVGRLFDEARQEATGYEPYARQIASMFAHDPAVLEELLGGLVHIAKADGAVHPAELEYLRRVAGIFGFDEAAFERIRASFQSEKKAAEDAYTVLGVVPSDTDAAIKAAYRKLIRENHPDALMAKGLPQDFIDLATEKMAAINAAYDQIEKERGLK